MGNEQQKAPRTETAPRGGAVENDGKRARRRVIQGVVVSDKADKTRAVDVERRVKHPFYEKIIRRRSRFYAHDERNESHEGDLVEIMSTRPLSRLKRWRLVRIVKAAPRVAQIPAGEAAK